jgi:CRISPR-associated protein Csb3
MTERIVIPLEVRNPGAFLAGCGVVEIVSAFDTASTSHWERWSAPFGEMMLPATACVIETSIPEGEFEAAIRDGLSCRDRWDVITLNGRRLPLDKVDKDEPLTAAHVRIQVRDREEQFPVDYWYHQLPRADEEPKKLKQRLSDGKSAWKFWAGRMQLQKTLLGERRKPGLITSFAGANGSAIPGMDVATLILLERETGSSLNLDAAARPGALDRGIAANEAKRATGETAASRPALELLAAIGLSAFFPPRRLGGAGDSNGLHSTAGLVVDAQSHPLAFRYSAWAIDAPVPLARLLARGVELPGAAPLACLEARRVSAGGSNYRFEYARGSGSAPTEPPTQMEEEADA